MTKKSRRSRSRARRPRLSSAQLVRPATGGDSYQPLATPKDAVDSGPSDLRPEYAYVFSDLKRIGIIAAAMLALLVILAVALT